LVDIGSPDADDRHTRRRLTRAIDDVIARRRLTEVTGSRGAQAKRRRDRYRQPRITNSTQVICSDKRLP
jgi:hypothetical protein